ncbi:uncharacterized protein ARMOST_22337 [Armillaria ostoyae]|uniref:Uncharacterized protein n=1 Tax=Armillaria ostoyae TaxID=47428 RepID=A0A284SCK5_ARMOS|nr:uncharacterized protein ARMOST_22337 [Armillaria ostoyae]
MRFADSLQVRLLRFNIQELSRPVFLIIIGTQAADRFSSVYGRLSYYLIPGVKIVSRCRYDYVVLCCNIQTALLRSVR